MPALRRGRQQEAEQEEGTNIYDAWRVRSGLVSIQMASCCITGGVESILIFNKYTFFVNNKRN